ncbi:MAG: glycoside hydrolase family 13 protein [Actinomycetota bacterium]|uniref:Glycoside hydrolase family 13 protein n=1 Tax=Mycobacterium lentiflavum TaxID=141349 RepID=A0ABY3UN40_MYCLN|nr:glycoside hydrolase family 13 protein [Mycobacterium lentiflavum]MEE3064610.1 glycoside hydrolase family 13 protein [Actinomycetota bacterium]ULP41011.1 glycoside hydrolase family 13 protein [Mycobacterium lentiflavum]
MSPAAWWSNAVFYQVYPRSFADSNGDGVGDIDGIVAHLDHLVRLGIDAIWLSPVTVSPMADHGYDVADPRDIDPLFGGMPAIERLITAAHERNIKITMDVVPNHTSSQHAWFQAALAAGPGTDARERYYFRDGKGPDGALPPNNWTSVFGGPAWERVVEPDGNPGQYYLHLFDTHQPDLNWDNPEVFDDFEASLRFWLERGVDGFRIDVAHGMAKPAGLPDAKEAVKVLSHSDDDPRFNNAAVHDIHRKIRKIVDEYDGAVTIGEVWVLDNMLWAEYLRPDELHLGFNFRLTKVAFVAHQIHDAVENSLKATAIYDSVPTWTLSNHDIDREVTRYGGGEIGLRRARAMAMVMLALPGTVFIYNGEELGLPDVLDLPEEVLQDPTWERSGHTERGRDKVRVPLPWSGDTPPFGFSSSPDTWLPMPADWASLTVEKQDADPDSTLTFFRTVLKLRRERAEFDGVELEWLTATDDALVFRRPGGLVCALNTGKRPMALPAGELIFASAPLVDGQLPTDAAAWLV